MLWPLDQLFFHYPLWVSFPSLKVLHDSFNMNWAVHGGFFFMTFFTCYEYERGFTVCYSISCKYISLWCIKLLDRDWGLSSIVDWCKQASGLIRLTSGRTVEIFLLLLKHLMHDNLHLKHRKQTLKTFLLLVSKCFWLYTLFHHCVPRIVGQQEIIYIHEFISFLFWYISELHTRKQLHWQTYIISA